MTFFKTIVFYRKIQHRELPEIEKDFTTENITCASTGARKMELVSFSKVCRISRTIKRLSDRFLVVSRPYSFSFGKKLLRRGSFETEEFTLEDKSGSVFILSVGVLFSSARVLVCQRNNKAGGWIAEFEEINSELDVRWCTTGVGSLSGSGGGISLMIFDGSISFILGKSGNKNSDS